METSVFGPFEDYIIAEIKFNFECPYDSPTYMTKNRSVKLRPVPAFHIHISARVCMM